MARGVINWGSPVSSVLEDGQLYTQQARATEASGEYTFILYRIEYNKKKNCHLSDYLSDLHTFKQYLSYVFGTLAYDTKSFFHRACVGAT